MKFIRLSKKDIPYLTPFESSFNNEGDLYLYKGDLIKILPDIDNQRRKTILKLTDIQDDSYVTPLYGILTGSKNELNGFGMQYFKEYITLSKYITQYDLSFEERKKIAIRICLLMKKLEQYSFLYYDIHSDNFLINDGDIKVIDMDSGIFRPNESKDLYQIMSQYSKNYLSNLCLQILWGTDINLVNDIESSKKQRIMGRCNDKEKIILSHAFEQSFDDYEILDYIDYVTEETIQDEKITLGLRK